MGFTIARVQVEEGFLNGLDLRFESGLNVVIGARGTGKTSLIELIRFCLDAPGFTEEANTKGRQQALSVLQGGKVTVTLVGDGDEIAVTRTRDDAAPRSSGPLPSVTVLAQNEIEAVGAKEEGRLHLIDRCRADAPDLRQKARALAATLRGQTAEIETLLRDIDKVQSQLDELSKVEPELAIALEKQEELLRSVEATQSDRDLLNQLQQASSQLAVRAAVYERSKEKVAEMKAYLGSTYQDAFSLEPWPEEAGSDDQLVTARQHLGRANELIKEADHALDAASDILTELTSANDASRIKVDERSRELRKKLSALQEGADVLTRRVNELREHAGQRQALVQYRDERRKRLDQLIAQRRAVYDELEAIRDARFNSRLEVAQRLTKQLDPPIRVRVSRASRKAALVSAVEVALRGSGLHRSTLAPLLAESLAPVELVEAIEREDANVIANAANIPVDRAGAVVAQMRGGGAADVIAAAIGDSVDLELLDGAEYKSTAELSIGQRCTVVLPILLAESADILIVDQPEDHLDNAYIAATLVPALRARKPGEQVLLSSHNANIPVLGEADRVILLDSDGRRGFERHSGRLDDPETIQAVTNVMEGGREAFRTRGESYGMSITDDG
jgi:ABC-type lipoprotein export system ATPase subunit/uncharacterized coiled-coil DUF342 family protein